MDSKWIVIDGNIYDVTKWQKRHPGGARLISHFAGQDATVCIRQQTSCQFIVYQKGDSVMKKG